MIVLEKKREGAILSTAVGPNDKIVVLLEWLHDQFLVIQGIPQSVDEISGVEKEKSLSSQNEFIPSILFRNSKRLASSVFSFYLGQ